MFANIKWLHILFSVVVSSLHIYLGRRLDVVDARPADLQPLNNYSRDLCCNYAFVELSTTPQAEHEAQAEPLIFNDFILRHVVSLARK